MTSHPRPETARTGERQSAADVLPYLRRHARALTGSQETGDRYAAATLEAVIADGPDPAAGSRPDIALFNAFYRIWQSSGAHLHAVTDEPGARGQALRRLSRLTPNTREALLLHTVEGFDVNDVARIMSVEEDEAQRLIDVARTELHEGARGRVLIIEDESMIVMDLEAILRELGHEIAGTAATHDEAVAEGLDTPPDLVLADIQLADGSSGIDAVNDLLARFPDLPVIFITAFPKRLLTGERPEPSFLIPKPFTPAQVASAVSQAMFFCSTETLQA